MPSNPKSDRSFWSIVAIAVISGLVAGLIGEVIIRTYAPGFWVPPASLNLSSFNPNNSGLIIPNVKTVVVNQDLKTTEALNSLRPVLVSLFKTVATSTAETAAGTALTQKPGYYALNDPLAVGLIITSDGWVVAPVPSALLNNFKAANFVVITSDRHLYHIDQVQESNGAAGPLLIFHLSGAANLPVRKIIARADLTLGESLLIVEGLSTVEPTTLMSLTRPSGPLSSEDLSASLALNNKGAAKDAFVFDLAGDLVALVDDNQRVIPAFSYESVWSSLGQTAAAAPFLGVNYLDLSQIQSPALTLYNGAWLVSEPGRPAVLKNSPAAAAGLQAGDIITWVDNQTLDATHGLADVLSGYRAGNTVTFTYERDGVEKTVNVKLGVRP